MVKCGFLDDKPIRCGDLSASPMLYTTSLLASQKQFYYADDEQDMTLVRVEARGTRHGKKTGVIYQLVDTRDLESGLTSMQRTVGFTLSLGAQLILERKLDRSGLLTPLDVPYEKVFPRLEKHNIHVQRLEIPADRLRM